MSVFGIHVCMDEIRLIAPLFSCMEVSLNSFLIQAKSWVDKRKKSA